MSLLTIPSYSALVEGRIRNSSFIGNVHKQASAGFTKYVTGLVLLSFFKRGLGIKNKKKKKKTTLYRALLNKHSGKSLSRKLNLSFSK